MPDHCLPADVRVADALANVLQAAAQELCQTTVKIIMRSVKCISAAPACCVVAAAAAQLLLLLPCDNNALRTVLPALVTAHQHHQVQCSATVCERVMQSALPSMQQTAAASPR